MAGIEDRIARTNRELDDRVRRLVGKTRYPTTVKYFDELTPAQRERYFGDADFQPTPSTARKRGRR